jgi:hypothetical protein
LIMIFETVDVPFIDCGNSLCVVWYSHATIFKCTHNCHIQAIADTGATSIFIMTGANVDNKHVTTLPLTINLPNGKQIQSTHVCNIIIPVLPTVLTA